MELKRHPITKDTHPVLEASNCTNMELKRLIGEHCGDRSLLLIAPIWN